MHLISIAYCQFRRGHISEIESYGPDDFTIEAPALTDLINTGDYRLVKLVHDLPDYDGLFKTKRRGSGWIYHLIGFSPWLHEPVISRLEPPRQQ